MARRLTSLVATAAVIATACGSDEQASSPPAATMPPGLEVCAAITAPGDAVVDDCLDAIEFQLAVDTITWSGGSTPTWDHFDRAVAPISDMLDDLDVGTAFSRDPDPGDDSGSSTDPIETTWRIGDGERTLWTCFAGDDVTVSTASC